MLSRGHPVLLTMSILFVAFAGCSSGGKGSDVPTEEPDPTTGAVRGNVLADDGTPIQGAQVAIRNSTFEAQTDDAGSYEFTGVPPGEQVVVAGRIGFETTQRVVTVVVGETAELDFELVEVAIPGLPRRLVEGPLAGHFFCGFGINFDYNPYGGGPCNVVIGGDEWNAVSENETNFWAYPDIIERHLTSGDRFTGVQLEVTWTSVTSAAEQLQASLQVDEVDLDEEVVNTPVYGSAAGRDVLRIRAVPGQAPQALPNQVVESMKNDTAGFDVLVIPFAEPPAAPANPVVGHLANAAVFLNQDFEVWFTLFYNEPIPADYELVPDE